MLDLLVRNARLADGRQGIDIAVRDGRIVEVNPGIDAETRRLLDADGWLVLPPFVDSHFHIDATLSAGRPRVNQSGTLLEGIDIWAELLPSLTYDDVYTRAREQCHWAIAQGCLAIRSHVDISHESLVSVEALLQLKRDIAPWLDLQLVAFPQNGLYRQQGARENLLRALDMGVEIVGGIPHFERTMAEGGESVRDLCEIAESRGLMVDLHCDETDDPMSRHVETLSAETRRLGLGGRVAASHVTSMHSMDNYYVSKLLPLMREAELAVISNPLVSILIQGRHDAYPKRRGLTRIPEIVDHGIPLALGHDCVMDPWYSLGSHDMLEVAHMAVHAAHMSGEREMAAMVAAVTATPAQIMELEGYGLDAGCQADFVVLQARGPVEALRTRAGRLHVVRRGSVIATSQPRRSELKLGEEQVQVDFLARPSA